MYKSTDTSDNMLHAVEEKASKISEKMNKITNRLKESLDIADDMTLACDDVIEYVDTTVSEIDTSDASVISEETYLNLVNLDALIDDFSYVRKILKENTEVGRKIMSTLCVEISASESEVMAQLATSFAEVNKAISDNTKLLVASYKEITNIITNLEKIKNGTPNKINNTLNITNVDTVTRSTAEIIESIRKNMNGKNN